jgi:hypothetical protein
MKKEFLLCFIIVSSFSLIVCSQLWADVPPPPANQITGIPDSVFNNLEETDCRFCHEDPNIVSGDTHIPNRHHNLMNSPIQTGECSISGNVCIADGDCPAGETCRAGTVAPDTDSDNDGQTDATYQCLNCHIEDTTGGIITLIVFRDCLVCHVQVAGEASVHHLTPTAQGIDSPLGDPDVGDCTPCHGTLVDDTGDGHFIPDYAPTPRTPTPSGGIAFPLNSRGNGTGACDYCHDDDGLLPDDPNKAIYTNQETHHGTGFGVDSAKCDWCHDFTLPVEAQIRVCEGCHGPDSLHAIQTDSDGDGVITPGIELPFYGHIGEPDDCWGCHGFTLSASPGTGPMVPYIAGTNEYVLTAGADTGVTLTGAAFTNLSQGIELTSIVALMATDGSLTYLTPGLISENSLTVTIPGTTAPGNYRVRVVKDTEESNPIVITIVPEVVIADDTCNKKKGTLTLTGSGFGEKPAGTDDYINVEVDGQSVDILSWSDTQIRTTVSRCSNKATITVNALYGSATSGDSGGGGKPPKPCKGKGCNK